MSHCSHTGTSDVVGQPVWLFQRVGIGRPRAAPCELVSAPWRSRAHRHRLTRCPSRCCHARQSPAHAHSARLSSSIGVWAQRSRACSGATIPSTLFNMQQHAAGTHRGCAAHLAMRGEQGSGTRGTRRIRNTVEAPALPAANDMCRIMLTRPVARERRFWLLAHPARRPASWQGRRVRPSSSCRACLRSGS